jgi:hypothetical protein
VELAAGGRTRRDRSILVAGTEIHNEKQRTAQRRGCDFGFFPKMFRPVGRHPSPDLEDG